MSTKTIAGLTAASTANITGAALFEIEDSASASRKATGAQVRTQMFAGGTGYTATDPLVAGTTTLTTSSATAFTVGRQGATSPAFQVDASTASSATGLKVKAAAAAGGLALSVITSGTNENLALDAAGSGTITLGGTSTGRVHLARLLTVATTVTTGAAAGDIVVANAVGLRGVNAAGTTTLAMIHLDGADNVYLAASSQDIRWGKALVALGGGAAPTFGTIGGTGPTAAAQNTWMRVLDSGANAFWVPAWK